MTTSIAVDPRAGSQDYIEPLKRAGVPIEVRQLAAGDVEIVGLGVGGRPTLVGIECKKWPDVLACVRNGRFADQARGMRRLYEVRWLLIEGRLRVNARGKLEDLTSAARWHEVPGSYTPQEVSGWLLTMVQCGGVLPWFSESRSDSVAWLRSLWLWWSSKEWQEHRAHLDWFQPPLQVSPFVEPSLVEQVAAVLPGMGATRARAAAEAFPSVRLMLEAPPEDWIAVPGIGRRTAERIVAALGSSTVAPPPTASAPSAVAAGRSSGSRGRGRSPKKDSPRPAIGTGSASGS